MSAATKRDYRRVTDDEHALRRSLVEQGLSYEEIGSRRGITAQAAQQWAAENGLVKPSVYNSIHSGSRGQIAYQMGIVEGLAWSEVGEKLNTNNDYACQLARRYAKRHSLRWRYRGNKKTLPPMEVAR